MSDFLEVDFAAEAKVRTQCDNCKQGIDTTKPKPKKDPKTGKAVPQLNPAIQAKLEAPLDSGELKDFHFCDEECLRQYLNKRAKTK